MAGTQRFGAAAVVIGNEVLSAKVQDVNGVRLIQRFRERGVPLRSVSIVPDEVEAIVDAVARARDRVRWVVTSGGIGPTHDDVTVRAVALALGRRVVRLPEMLSLLRAHGSGDLVPEALRLAEAPEGTRLLPQPETWFPVLACDDVFLLPGVPALFALQLETVLATLPAQPLFSRCLFVSRGESEIAAALDRVALQNPLVTIGSYPQFGQGLDHRVRITVEGPELAAVNGVVVRLQRELPRGAVVRLE